MEPTRTLCSYVVCGLQQKIDIWTGLPGTGVGEGGWDAIGSGVVVVIGQELSPKECENLGFTGLALCSDCNSFADFVKDQDLVSDCKKCCTEDSDDSMSKIIYSGAVLEVCMRKLVFYPEIVGFIEEEKEKFPTVKVNYVYNSPPKLIMLNDDGQHKETIRVDNWKREHILQFLREKVKPTSAS
ncbi:selenoprotein F [Heracleum sosnowskyi]|uniref:Selenoprotein F n=1 Tax=Heracleum sosnowskyi TaxID=360622 RepID=A0AAD8ITW3_9APIA|nr:selenoprotein F [Heracleum sosnowskyi]